MGLLSNLFGKKEEPINSYADFWNWFAKHAQAFHKTVKSGKGIPENFFSKLEPALAQVKSDIYYLTGMYDNDTAELVLTAEGEIKEMVFVEELIRAAPPIKGWRFTALKPAIGIENANISMSGYTFNRETLSFYPDVEPEFPDEINITFVHTDYAEEDGSAITNGVCIFLDNFLGEVNFSGTIDNVTVIGKESAEQELIPIEKLPDYIKWRQKEFVEKYDAVRYDTGNDTYSVMEATLKSGFPLVANVNTSIMEWDAKPSYPYSAVVEIDYDGSDFNGLPKQPINENLIKIEDEITAALMETPGCLYIGRQSCKNVRKIFYSCKEFRASSKAIYSVQRRYEGEVTMRYKIYLDKYWYAVDHLRKKVE